MGYAFLPNQKDADIRDIDAVYINNLGAFLVIDIHNQIRGSVGVRRYSKDTAELKRLYIDQEYRGIGLGYTLCMAAIENAMKLGYRFLRLDTTMRFQAAMGLFKKLGFKEIERYNTDPFAEIFMELIL